MRKYEGDWGTIEVMKTFCAYLMKKAIGTGKRLPRANYQRAAENSAKRNPNGLRGPRYGQAALRKSQVSAMSTNPTANINTLPSPDKEINFHHPATEPTICSQLSQPGIIGHWDNTNLLHNEQPYGFSERQEPPNRSHSGQHIARQPQEPNTPLHFLNTPNPAFMQTIYQPPNTPEPTNRHNIDSHAATG